MSAALTKQTKKIITMDWARLFPQLAVRKPMYLLRAVGPLVIVILLERDSANDCYLPIVHVHNLCRSTDVMRLTLAQTLRTKRTNAADRIKVRDHESRYREAAE